MRFCENCDRAMVRDTSSGVVVFRCHCGAEEPGGPEDARLGGAVLGSTETTDMYHLLIRHAAFDRVNQQVRRQCPNAECNRDYMTQIRVGEAEVVIYVCPCGVQEGAIPAEPGA